MKKEKFMRSFKDYTPQSSPQDESEILKEAATAPDPAMESSAAELTKKIAAAFNGKSNSDMLRSILGEAEKSKRAGTLSNAEIDTFYEQVFPAVEQRAAPPAQIRGGKTQKDLTPRGKKQRKGMKKRCPFFLVRRLFPRRSSPFSCSSTTGGRAFISFSSLAKANP